VQGASRWRRPYYNRPVPFLGAAYLVYLGIRAILRRPALDGSPAPAALEPHPKATSHVFRRAILTNVLNPKVALFFLALVPQFVSAPRGHVALQFLLLGAIFNTTGTCVNALVGASAAELGRRLTADGRFRLLLDRVTGGIFIALGVRLALARQR
jgi:threonine/homoserine/homoserine lactone efflux protein